MNKSITIFCLMMLVFSCFSLVASDVDSTIVGEDLLIVGDDVDITEPVYGDVLAIGGKITINAPIYGDLIAFAGDIDINKDVEGKIIVAGGTVRIRANVNKVLVAGGTLEIHNNAMIRTNAYVASQRVENNGIVSGEMRVISRDFENNGDIGNLELYEMYDFDGLGKFSSFIRFVIRVISVLISIGFAILGILLLKTFKKQFLAVEQEIRSSPVIVTVLGFMLLLGSLILSVLLTITLVGIPFAILLASMMGVALILSCMFVSLAIGRKLGEVTNWNASDTWYFIAGFIIVKILTWIPFIDMFFLILFLSVGLGALFYAVKNNWTHIVRKDQ